MSENGIAIVGMSGRFPGAHDISTFWTNIKDGVESIARFSDDDLEIAPPTAGVGDIAEPFVGARGILDDIESFDARFFGYLPREAELIDPQQRLFLELCWQAMEDAAYDPRRFDGAVGVFGGCFLNSYLHWNLCSDRVFQKSFTESIQVGELPTEIGNDKDYLATRVAFKLGLRGPAITLQTACSTSLVAVAAACQSLETRQCDMALAGGVTIVLPQRKGYYYRRGGILSPDGHCRPFDEQAAGTVFSNGAAVVLLKRLSDAIQDGDTIYAVIRAYAMNNDGGDKLAFTAPSIAGQADVISKALSAANVDARSIGFVETHGTATQLGDPIEIAGLRRAYAAHTSETGYCAIGSVKANVGHLDVAAGVASLIKATLAVREGVIPPAINFTRSNPALGLINSPFYVNTDLRPWPAGEWPRRAAVSALGVGGTNAHVIVEQAPISVPSEARRTHSLFVLSARSEAALASQADRLATHLEAHPDLSLEDVAYTLQIGRREFEHRRATVAGDRAGAIAKLRAPAAPGESGRPEKLRPKIVFMYTGQGAQYPGMARELYATEPVFREVIDQCCAALAEGDEAVLDIRPSLLWDSEGRSDESNAAASETLAQTHLAQPAIFAIEMALTRLLESWGIRPHAVLGHSVGEFAAACTAGVFEIADAARLVAARGRLMAAQPPGQMLAVRAGVDDLAPLLSSEISVAAVNAPTLTVVSGPSGAIGELGRELARRSIQASPLVTSHAYHSAMMTPARAPLVQAVAGVSRKSPKLKFVSSALARELDESELLAPEYWGDQLMLPVRFADAVALAAADENCLLIEVGPGQTLATLARQCLPSQGGRTIVPCLGPVQSPGWSTEHILSALGKMWVAGAAPDWSGLHDEKRQRVPLPTYPFERKRCWVEPTPFSAEARSGTSPSVSVMDLNDSGSPRSESENEPRLAGLEELLQVQLARIDAYLRSSPSGVTDQGAGLRIIRGETNADQ